MYYDGDLESKLERIKDAQMELENARKEVSRDIVAKVSEINAEAEALLKEASELMEQAQKIADLAGIPYDLPTMSGFNFTIFPSIDWQDSWD